MSDLTGDPRVLNANTLRWYMARNPRKVKR